VKVGASDGAKVPNVLCPNRKWGAANSTSASRWSLTFQDFFLVTISTLNNPGKRSLYSVLLRAGRSGVRITACGRDILFYKTDQTNHGAYPASCSMDTGVF